MNECMAIVDFTFNMRLAWLTGRQFVSVLFMCGN